MVKFLIKLFCLLSLLSSFSFSKDVWVMTDDVLDGLKPMNNCEFFLGKNFLKCSFQKTGTYRVIKVNSFNDYLYFNPTRSSGYYYNTMYYYFIDKIQYSGYFKYLNKFSYYKYSESDAQNGKLFTYTNIIEFRLNESSYVECSSNQAFNSETNQCESCPKDHILNQETGKCEPEQKRPDWCPRPMIYNERKVELLLRDTIV